MSVIPLIVGFGGINAAGRSSFHHGHNRTIIDSLSKAKQEQTWQSLRALTGDMNASDKELAARSLIREIEPQYFDHKKLQWNRNVPFETESDCVVSVSKKRIPATLPDTWSIIEDQGKTLKIKISGLTPALLHDYLACDVGSAGQIPTGFDAGSLYPSRSHPKAIQLGVYAATDALGSMGLNWDTIANKISPDQVSVYSGSCLGQLDADGLGGLWARQQGKRVTSKNMPLGLAEMPADFINAYILGTTGSTGLVMGACATFHYNLRAAIKDIESGKAKIAIVGASDAGITPEVIDGFHTMGALATKKGLQGLDNSSTPDYRRACRPFGANCGFTMAEAAQTIVIMADDLAIDVGAQIFGSIADVFVNADGYKKSISGPGIGNHITVAKGAGLIRDILGKKALKHRSYVHAHGTGTPQNRVTESQIFNQVAEAFGITDWPVAAIKCFVGHTLGAAGGDQLMSALGTWNSGIIPGITTVSEIAEDVHQRNLQFSLQHNEVGVDNIDACLLNAKGFGGNNATSVVLSPAISETMLKNKHGSKVFNKWQKAKEHTEHTAKSYDDLAVKGEHNVVYKFDNNVRNEEHIRITENKLSITGYENSISLTSKSHLSKFLTR